MGYYNDSHSLFTAGPTTPPENQDQQIPQYADNSHEGVDQGAQFVTGWPLGVLSPATESRPLPDVSQDIFGRDSTQPLTPPNGLLQSPSAVNSSEPNYLLTPFGDQRSPDLALLQVFDQGHAKNNR